MVKIHANAVVSLLTDTIPISHVSPSVGNNTTVAFNKCLQNNYIAQLMKYFDTSYNKKIQGIHLQSLIISCDTTTDTMVYIVSYHILGILSMI